MVVNQKDVAWKPECAQDWGALGSFANTDVIRTTAPGSLAAPAPLTVRQQ